MKLNEVIAEWNRRTGKELPTDITFRNYDEFEELCQDMLFSGYPTFAECNAIWNELLDGNKIQEKKDFAIKRASQMSFEQCKIPMYQQINAALGIYTPERCLYITKVIDKYRQEYYRLRELIKKAKTFQEIDNILINNKYEMI